MPPRSLNRVGRAVDAGAGAPATAQQEDGVRPLELLHPAVSRHLDTLAGHDDPLLREMEERAAQEGFPIVGPAAGAFCHLVARLAGARRVFEMGSGFGYSTLWFARAVAANGGGEVHHTVWDPELSRQARAYFARAGLPPSVEVVFHVGEAVATLRGLPGPFDLIFVDIDKEGYPAALEVARERLRSGGVLIVDNMLWSGKVLDPEDRSPATTAIRETTRLLFRNPAFSASLIPIRDGLAIARFHGPAD